MPWWKRSRIPDYEGEIWAVVFEFEVWAVADLPPFEGQEEARRTNADSYDWGRQHGWRREPDWLPIAQASVECVRESTSWSHGDWARRAHELFSEQADLYAFDSLFGGVNVSSSTWYDGRHRALAQIDAGAQEIVVAI